MSQPTKFITIAASDSSGGDGIQADGKVFSKYYLYPFNVITSSEWAHDVHSIDAQIIF